VIINSSSNRCVWWWARHLESEDNDKVRLVKSEGLRADSIYDMLQEMVNLAAGTKCENPFYQMNFNPAPHEELTEEQWDRVREIAEKKHGLEGQPYFMVMHTKYGREHPHFIYSRIDLEKMKAISDSNDAKKNHAIARAIEQEFGLQKVVGPYDRAAEAPRPKRAPKKWESYRAGQSGLRIEDIEAEVSELYQQSESGRAFREALDRRGYILAVGDRVVAGQAALMIIDTACDDHSLSRRLSIKTKELNAFMRDVDRAGLPDIRQAQELQQERKIAALEADRDTVKHEIEWEETLAKAAIKKEERERNCIAPEDRQKELEAPRVEPSQAVASEFEGPFSQPKSDREKETRAGGPEAGNGPAPTMAGAPELGKTQAEIRLARSLSPGPQSFANALEDRGFMLTRVTPDDIQKEMEKLLEEWEERRRNPQSWMEHEGGYADLTSAFQESARRSFDAWEEKQEQDQQKRQGQDSNKISPAAQLSADEIQKRLESYVDYVQRRWAEGPKSRLEQAAEGLAVVTPFGSVYTLTSRNTGLDREELPHYLKGIDQTPLLSVTEAQAVMEDVREHRRGEWQHRHEEWLAQQPLGVTAAGIRLAYGLTKTGPEFADALEDRGLILARMTEADAERLNRWERQRLREEWTVPNPEKEGKPRKTRDIESYNKYQADELVVVNQYGTVFQLTAATTGTHAAEREERLKDIERGPLMDVTAAQTAMLQYQHHRRQEWRAERQRQFEERLAQQPLGATAAGIRLAYSLTHTGPEFAAALEDRGLALACVTEADAQRLNRWERGRLREEWTAPAPEKEGKPQREERDIEKYNKYRAGELVVINEYGAVFQLTAATTGALAAEREERLKEIDRSSLMDVTSAQSAMQQFQHHQRQEWRQQRQDTYRQTLNEKVSPVAPPQPELPSASLFAQAAGEAATDHRVDDLRGPAAEVWEQHRRAGNEHYFSDKHAAVLSHSVETGNPLRHSVKTKGDREAFAAALDELGVTFASASKEEADKSHRQARFAREIGNYAPRYKESEIVIVTERRLERLREGEWNEPGRVFKLDPSLAEKFVKALGTADKLQSIEATLKASDERAQRRRDERADSRHERATDLNDGPWTLAWKAARMMDSGAKTAASIMEVAPRAVNAAFDISTQISGMVFSLLNLIDGPKSPLQQARDNFEGEKLTAERNAEAEERIDFSRYAAERGQHQRNAQEEQAAKDRQRENERQR
jgi:hypothetical protein